jgi:hypothetical protein
MLSESRPNSDMRKQVHVLEKLIISQLVKKLPAFYETPKFRYRGYKNPPMDTILSQLNLIHTYIYLNLPMLINANACIFDRQVNLCKCYPVCVLALKG